MALRAQRWIAVSSLVAACFSLPALAQSASTSSNNDGVNMAAPKASPAPEPTTPDIPRNTPATTPDMDQGGINKGTGGSGFDPSTTPSTAEPPSTEDHNPVVHDAPQSANR